MGWGFQCDRGFFLGGGGTKKNVAVNVENKHGFLKLHGMDGGGVEYVAGNHSVTALYRSSVSCNCHPTMTGDLTLMFALKLDQTTRLFSFGLVWIELVGLQWRLGSYPELENIAYVAYQLLHSVMLSDVVPRLKIQRR